MNLVSKSTFIALCFLVSGCSTTQEVTLSKTADIRPIVSVAQVKEDGNSPQMDAHLISALHKEGLSFTSRLPEGTKTSPNVDALVSYVDVWRWDIVMYLKSIVIRFHDAQNGDLLVQGQWSDSPLHGYRDSKIVVEGLISEMLSKMREQNQPE